MENNFKPGDLALTKVFDVAIPVGSQVELVERIEKGQEFTCDGYKMRAPSVGWHVVQPTTERKCVYGEVELMPLRGDHAPDLQLVTGKPEPVSA